MSGITKEQMARYAKDICTDSQISILKGNSVAATGFTVNEACYKQLTGKPLK